jgi:Domain of unknown function (DUF4124)
MEVLVMRIALVAASMLIGLSVSAQPYKWVDSNGRVQYSDHRPPTAKNAEPVKNRLGSAVGPVEATKAEGTKAEGAKAEPMTTAEKEQAFRKRKLEEQEKAEKQAKADELARERKEACTDAQRRLGAMDAGMRMTRHGDNGERVVMNEAEIAADKARTAKFASEACK